MSCPSDADRGRLWKFYSCRFVGVSLLGGERVRLVRTIRGGLDFTFRIGRLV